MLQFVKFWKQRTGGYPQELIFDSKLTTYKNLDKLNALKIGFMTLRRRSKPMLAQIHKEPLSAWRRIELQGVSRIYRHPKILDQKIQLKDYQQPIRQIVINELGREAPIFLLTNQLKRSAPKLIQRYAQRMIIENSIEELEYQGLLAELLGAEVINIHGGGSYGEGYSYKGKHVYISEAKHGILIVQLPKREEVKPRRIEVKAG